MRIRAAEAQDSERLFAWRNDPTTIAMSASGLGVGWQNHQTWYSAILASPESQILIGLCDTVPCGMVRFDRQAGTDTCEVSINLAPEVRGARKSRVLLLGALKAYSAPGIVQICAKVRFDNLPSQRLFEGCGFKKETDNGPLLNFRLLMSQLSEASRS